eukprot:m.339594 g.339594  ORF g.339594 m.339594 type:complete len:543 (+) comp18876_c0_seq1:180-1808(+)
METDDGTFALPADFMVEPTKQQAQSAPTMLCCECGVVIEVNPAALCANCIRTKEDISEGIPKQAIIYYCRGCYRYLQPPNAWIVAELESRELLSLCLKRLKGLSKVKLIDASFVWTEPHSKRVKVKLTIQKEVMSGAILQQVFIVEYVVNHQMCEECHRREAKDTWTAVVQLRQKVKHKKTFFYLEQLIIKHRAQRDAVNIIAKSDGVDFFFSSRSHAKKLEGFLSGCSPIRSKTSERLISSDIQNATYNYKFTFSVEIAPICRGDIVCFPKQVARKHGNISPFAICDHVGSVMHFVDPFTLKQAEISAEAFFRQPFNSIATHGDLIEFVILDIELVDENHRSNKIALADATVVRARDLGVNDTQYLVRTHLGHILSAGDNAWGYDFVNGNLNDDNANKLKDSDLPEVMLVKKSFTDRSRRRRRKWKLRTMTKEVEEGALKKLEMEAAERDYESFLQDIEEDKDLRSKINIYKDPEYQAPTISEVDDEELRISMEEMLDGFDDLDIGPDPEDASPEKRARHGGTPEPEESNLKAAPLFEDNT